MTSTFDATGMPSSVATSSINIPSWALLTNTGPSWDPSIASAAAVIVSGANTNVGTGTAAPTVTGGNTGDNNGLVSAITRTPTPVMTIRIISMHIIVLV